VASFHGGLGFYPERMLDLGGIDAEEIVTALADQTDCEHRWLIYPRTGRVAFWTSNTGIDGENRVEIDELGLILIDPLPSSVWYRDMADFADGISDSAAGRRLTQSRQGGVQTLQTADLEHHPELISAWHALRDVRAQRRAVSGCVIKDSSTTAPRIISRPTTQSRPPVKPAILTTPKGTPTAAGDQCASLRRVARSSLTCVLRPSRTCHLTGDEAGWSRLELGSGARGITWRWWQWRPRRVCCSAP